MRRGGTGGRYGGGTGGRYGGGGTGGTGDSAVHTQGSAHIGWRIRKAVHTNGGM